MQINFYVIFQDLAGKYGQLRRKVKKQFKNLPKEDRELVEALGDVSISSSDLEQQEKDRFSDLIKEFSGVKVK